MRGIAATGVLVSHVAFTTGFVSTPFWGGWLSRMEGFVSLFFVLSGFVLFRPYAVASALGGRWPGVARYAVRRFFRIVPAYWLLVAFCFVLLADQPVDLPTWLRHLTFTQYYVAAPLLPGVGVAWTLMVEVVFYMLLPFLAVPLVKRSWRPVRTVAIVLAVGFGISLGWLSHIRPGGLSVFLHTNWFPSFLMCFGVGMAMAVASVALRTGTAPQRWAVLDRIGRAPWACWGIAVALFGLSTVAAGPLGGLGLPSAGDLVAEQLLYLGFSAFLLLPVVYNTAPTPLSRMLSHPVLRWIGTISYGLFLWHLTVVELVIDIQGPLWGTNTLRLFVITLVGGLGLAALSWYAVERPAQRLGERLLRRRGGRTPTGDNRAQPQRAGREDAGDVYPPVLMRSIGDENEPAADEQRDRGRPPLQRA